MLRSYGISLVGQYHLDEGSTVCQDANDVEYIDDEVIVAAVADGVGSELYSDIGSKIASKTCVEFCKMNYNSFENKNELLEDAFKRAFYSVKYESNVNNIPFNQMDCTLCVILYTPEKIYCGNVGDSGAIGLKDNGEYVCLTEQQNDENGSVFPLAATDKWTFAEFESDYVAILLATDGFYNRLFPKYIQKSSFIKIDYEMIREYIDPDYLVLDDDESLKQNIRTKLDKIPRDGSWDGINDDITVAGIICKSKHEIFNDYVQPIDRLTLKKKFSTSIREALYGKKRDNIECGENKPSPDVSNLKVIMKNDDHFAEITSLRNKYPQLNFIEWPDECHDNEIDQTCESLSDFISNINKYSIPRRTKIAYNIAATISKCHRMNLSLGIISLDNIRVNNRGVITYCNLKPDQISENKGMTVPTSLIKIDSNIFDENISRMCVIDKKLENLVLAVIVFRLIFNGNSPYSVQSNGKYDYCFKFKNSNTTLPDINQFPDYLINLFERAFDDDCNDSIPSSEEWLASLDHYSVDIVVCKNKKSHIHYIGAKYCPYCKVENYSDNRC